MTDITTMFNDLFQALFFGSGNLFGLLLVLLIFFIMVMVYPKSGLLLLPVSIFWGINYLNYDLGWHGLIMFLLSVFIMFDLAYSVRKHKL